MAFGAGFFGAASAAPGGYLDAKKEMADTDVRRAQATEAQNDVMGQAAFGRALQLMFGGGGPQVPGGFPERVGAGFPPRDPAGPSAGVAIPRPPGDIPQPGPPGGGQGPLTTEQLTSQPSPMGGVSNSRFNQTFMQPLLPPQQTPQMAPQGQPGGPPGGTMTGGPQPPPMASGPPGAPPPGGQPQPGQQQQGQPALTLEGVMQAMIRANPGAPPAVIAAGVNRFLPMMNAQAQQQWKEITLQLRQQALDNAQTRFQQGEQRRTDQGGARIANQSRGLDIREEGEKRRGEESVSRRGDRETRTDLAKQREQRQAREGEARGADRDKRTQILSEKEQRQAAESKERLELIKTKLTSAQANAYTKKLESDAKIKKLNAEAEAAVKRNDIQLARARMSSMHLRAQELINEWALSGKIDPAVKKAVLEENRLLYNREIENLGKPKAQGGDSAPASPQGNAPQKLRINPDSGQLEGLPAGAQ